MTPERRLEIEEMSRLYGSANCWTGTSGTLAAMIRELLAELDERNHHNAPPPTTCPQKR